MVRRVFFSFHYERDIWRANQVRNCWVTQDRESVGFWDASLWEATKLRGEAAIKSLIDEGLKNTSVTVVLIGNQTADRKYVQYEIRQSYLLGKGLLGIYIHNLRDSDGKTDTQGRNPLSDLYIEQDNRKVFLSEIYKTYYWLADRGYDNIGNWVEVAAKQVRR